MRQKIEETSYRISNYIYWLISRMYKELKKSNRRTANHSNNKWADKQFSKQTNKKRFPDFKKHLTKFSPQSIRNIQVKSEFLLQYDQSQEKKC